MEENNIILKFAQIEKSGQITFVDSWKLQEKVNGAFFLINCDKSYIGRKITMRNSNDEEIWHSKIKYMPDIFFDREGKKINYLSDNAINTNNIPIKSDTYNVTVEDSGINFQLSINTDVIIDDIPAEKEVVYSEEKTLSDYIKDITTCLRRDTKYTFNISNDLAPMERKTENIIIEKVKNNYLTTICGLSFKNFKLVEDQKVFINFSKGIDKYIDKVRDILKKMYMLTENEFNKLSILVITDEPYENSNEKVEVINREDAIIFAHKCGCNFIRYGDKKFQFSATDKADGNIWLEIKYNDSEEENIIREQMALLKNNFENMKFIEIKKDDNEKFSSLVELVTKG